MHIVIRRTLLAAALGIGLLPTAALPAEPIDLSRLVVVGDSLSAGFQNGSLLAEQQVNGYASLIAAQAGVGLSLPLIAAPGIPNVLTLVDPGPPPVIVPEGGISTGRVDILTQNSNLAVPGATLADALDARPDFPIDSMTDFVLGFPGLLGGVSLTQAELAVALQPTAMIVWIGNNDVLGAAVGADASLLTPAGDFADDYVELIDTLAATGATLVIANLPDAASIPFLTPVEEVAEILGLSLEELAFITGVGPGDLLTPDAFPKIGVEFPLPDDVVLDAGEVAEIKERTAELNAVIAQVAAEFGATFVDINAVIGRAVERGLVVGGQRLTMNFLGGLVSLDGVHPTNTGYARIANAFIQAINDAHDADIPKVKLTDAKEADPLVLPGIGHPASSFEGLDAKSVKAIQATILD
jgi:lysophospholipase L1-like esterase